MCSLVLERKRMRWLVAGASVFFVPDCVGIIFVILLVLAMQLVVSLGFIYLCPNNALCHWMYLIGAFIVLAVAYVLFKRKYYHLHEEYLASLKK